ADDELADHGGALVGHDAELPGLLLVDRAPFEPGGGRNELGRQQRVLDLEVTRLAQPGARGDADATGRPGELSGPAEGVRPARTDPDGHGYGGVPDGPGQLVQLLGADHRAGAVELDDDGDHAGPLPVVHGPFDESGEHGIDQALGLDDAH